MSALEEAFLRVGIGRPVQRRVVELPRPAPAPIARRESGYKARLLEDKAAFDAMSDEELEIEHISLTENLESIRIELRLDTEAQVEHEPDWRRRAERATAIVRARLSLCSMELTKRRSAAAERDRAARQQRHAEIVQGGEAKRIAGLRFEISRLLRFKQRVAAILPHEEYLAIWGEVNAEAGEFKPPEGAA